MAYCLVSLPRRKSVEVPVYPGESSHGEAVKGGDNCQRLVVNRHPWAGVADDREKDCIGCLTPRPPGVTQPRALRHHPREVSVTSSMPDRGRPHQGLVVESERSPHDDRSKLRSAGRLNRYLSNLRPNFFLCDPARSSVRTGRGEED